MNSIEGVEYYNRLKVIKRMRDKNRQAERMGIRLVEITHCNGKCEECLNKIKCEVGRKER